MTINLADKKALKKLAKDLEKGESFKCEETDTELYKGWKFVVLDINSNKALFQSSKLEPAINFFNKHVQNCVKQRQKSLQSSRVQKQEN